MNIVADSSVLIALRRKFAELTGIKVLGTVGILILAKRQNIVKNLRNKLEELETAGFRLSSEIHEKALESVGEI
jgi:predicted nucleic acid-binding protein